MISGAKGGWLKTLTLSGLASAAAQTAATSDAGMVAAGASVVAGVIGNYLVNRATSQRDAQDNAEERKAFAERNHHLRRGMAAALRSGLKRAQADLGKLPADPYEALFAHWDKLLQQAAVNDDALEHVFPAQFAESHWEATNAYRPDLEEDARALAQLLREWLTPDPNLYARWSADAALGFARQALPYYRQAFADDLAADADGLLVRAFTVKGLNQIRALLERIEQKLQPRPIELGKVRTWSLPLPTSYFTGREEFLTGLHAALQETRKVLVSAGGGYGKTQTALEYVRRYGGNYEDVLWVRAADRSSLFESYRSIGVALGRLAPEAGSEAEVQRAVKSWLAEHPDVLLVMDNLDDPDIAREWWPTGERQPFLLATSQRNDVSELERMRVLKLEVWSPGEALEFLLRRTGRAELSSAESAAAAELASETGYLVLALEQAAAYIVRNSVSFADYLRTYRRVRLSLLNKQQPVAGDYHHSVATTWKASVERVSPAARELLDGLSHLSPHAIPLELISCAPDVLGPALESALTDETEVDALRALTADLLRYSLPRVDEDSRTVSVHRLLQEVVQEVVQEEQRPDERSEWEGRWIQVFARFLPEGAKHEESIPHSRGWPSFETLFLRMKRDHPLVVEAARLAHGYVLHFLHRGRWREAEVSARQAMQVREQVLGAEHPSTLVSVNNLAGLYESQGRFDIAEPLYLRALAACERVLGAEHPSTLVSANNLAALYKSQGRYGEAELLCLRALAACERVLGAEHPSTLTSVNNLAGLYESQDQYREAEPLYLWSLAARERVLGAEHPDTLVSVNNLAALCSSQGRYREAEQLYLRALTASERVLGAEHPFTLVSVNNLAGLCRSHGRYGQAEPLYLRALTTSERVLGAEHPSTLLFVNNLALLYESQGQFDIAEPLYLRALATSERVLGAEHPSTLLFVNNLAGLYESQGRFDIAEPLYLRALLARERVSGAEHSSTLTSINNLAQLYQNQKRYEEAEPLYLRALSARERVLGTNHPDTLTSVNNLALLYQNQGRYGETEPLCLRAVAASERVLGAEHPYTLSSINNLAGLYDNQGRYGEAEPLYRRALAGMEKVLGSDHPHTATVRGNLEYLRQRKAQASQ